MMRTIVLVNMLTLVLTLGVLAQPEGESSEGPTETEVYEPAPPPAAPVGDTVYLANGKHLADVKVARVTPLFIEIEFLPGEAPLQIPRNHVDRIEYARDRMAAQPGDGSDGAHLSPDIMPGEEVSAEFHRMLMAPLADEELPFEDADYLVVLREFARRKDIVLEIDEALRTMPDEARRFSYVIPPSTTLLAFLRKDMANIAPEVEVILQFDKIVLRKQVPPAPAPPPPPPPPSVPSPPTEPPMP